MHKMLLCLLPVILMQACSDKEKPTVGERVADTIVYVEQSSGVVINSGTDSALVLTAFHVIKDKCPKDAGCITDDINVAIVYNITLDDETRERAKKMMDDRGIPVAIRDIVLANDFIQMPESFKVLDIITDEKHDLALIEISVPSRFSYAPISQSKCRVGDFVFLAANPNRMFRTVNFGIISSVDRFLDNTPSIQFNGGLFFGSSGGGVFNEAGELIGVIQSMRVFDSPNCFDRWSDEGEYIGQDCVKLPIEFAGFAAKKEVIMQFLSESKYCAEFKLCK